MGDDDIWDMPREFTRSLAEHEILLSFNSDADAERFDSWWRTIGCQEFEKFRMESL